VRGPAPPLGTPPPTPGPVAVFDKLIASPYFSTPTARAGTMPGMASIFKRTYRRPVPDDATIIERGGKRVAKFRDKKGKLITAPLADDGTTVIIERSKYTIKYMGRDGEWHTCPGYTDKAATEQRAAELSRRSHRAREGLTHADPEAAETPLAKVLAAYVDDLTREGRDDMYRYNCGKLLAKLFKECGWGTLREIEPAGMTEWMGRAAKSGRAARTVNSYLDHAIAFVKWSIGQGKIEHNALAGIKKADATKKARTRRAFTPDQLRRFLDAAGPRRLLYLTAVLTGLRKGELRDLCWGSVVLAGDRPHIRLEAEKTKGKRADLLPLVPELVEELAKAKPKGAAHADHVFDRVPSQAQFKADLRRAGDIPYKDESGRILGFHALRKTMGTYLAARGVPLQKAQKLMRHTDPRLTTQFYTDADLLDLPTAAGEVATMMHATPKPDAARKLGATGGATTKTDDENGSNS